MNHTRASGIKITPRQPDLDFDDVVPHWFAGDPALSAAWNALGMIASAGEGTFITAGRSLLEQITDPEIAEDTRLFIQQETEHARVHARFSRRLATQGVPIAVSRVYLADLVRDLTERVGDKGLMAAALAGEQFIGEFGHAVLENLQVFDPADEAGSALWIWHAYEEVEHQAALHDAFTHVYGQHRAAHRARVEGVVYMLTFVGIAWPAITWGMMPPEARTASGWSRTVRHFFGSQGVLRKALPNLGSVLRPSFHPHDNHDPVRALHHARAAAVREEWEVSPIEIAGKSGSDVQHGLLTYLGFVRHTLRRTRRFRGELNQSIAVG